MMRRHVVQQGECLSSLAAQSGLSSWKDLYDHPSNTELKKKRPNPNILAPGDEVMLPDPTPTKRVSVAADRKHKFVVTIPRVKLRVAFVDHSGKAQEGKRFLVNVGAREIKGTTAADGLIEVEVRATESTARLRIWLQDDGADAIPTIDRELALGHVDPIDTTSGVQARLSNLGYRCPVSDEIAKDLDDPTLVAVRSFRARNGLPAVDRPKPQQSMDDERAEATGESELGRESTRGPTQEEIEKYIEQLVDDAFRKKLLAAYEANRPA